MFQGAIDLEDLDPTFKYNFFSFKHNDYIFEDPVIASNVTNFFEVEKDDQLELRFFQTKSLSRSVNPMQLQSQLGVLASTVQERSALTDYSYGDPFEVLAYAYAGVSVLSDYCWNCRTGYSGYCYPRLQSETCTSFEPISASMAMLGLYGISGYVAYTYIDPKTGKTEYESLLNDNAWHIDYCRISEDKRLGLQNVQLLSALRNAQISCDTTEAEDPALPNRRQQRRNMQVGSHGDVRQYPFQSFAINQKRGSRSVIGRWPRRSSIESLPAHQNQLEKNEHGFNGMENIRSVVVGRSDLASTVGSTHNENPLLLKLNAIGLDDGRVNCTWCGELMAGYQLVNYSDEEGSQESFDKYRYAGAVYVAVDVATVEGAEIRYSLDDSSPDCMHPEQESQHTCSKTQTPKPFLQDSRAFQYDGKTRIVLYALSTASKKTFGWDFIVSMAVSECSNLKVWMCHPRVFKPTNISVLNVTEALSKIQVDDIIQDSQDALLPVMPLGPLEPGPMVNMNFLVNQELSTVLMYSLQLDLCKTVWNISSDAEKCRWQIWLDLVSGSNIEIWNDYDFAWKRNENEFSFMVWTVSVTVLMESNTEAAQARHRLTKRVNMDDFIHIYHVQSTNVTTSPSDSFTKSNQYFAHVTAPWPAEKRDERSVYGCTTHYDCGDGMFCSYYALKTWDFGPGPNPFVGYAGCYSCSTCLDSEQSIDGLCPLDLCGPRAGTIPKCWDQQKLFSKFSCSERYPLNLSSLQTDKMADKQPGIIDKSMRARFLTPFNRLAGALVVRQKRLQKLNNVGKNNSIQVCTFKNDSFSKYSSKADQELGIICLDDMRQDAGLYGIDPVFASVSSLYNGKLNPFDFYNASELVSSRPYGFFPHAYDGQQRKEKEPRDVLAEMADDFLLFFDERISRFRADKMITYLKDGNFIDEQTSEISVEMTTINARTNILCRIVFTFTWQDGGKIVWDYVIWSVPIYLYSSTNFGIQVFLECMCLIFLGINILSELRDFIIAVKRFEIASFLTSPANWLDWCHFAVMSRGWWLWYQQIRMQSKLIIESSYEILASPADETDARFFMTNSKEEAKFLAFSKSIHDLGQNLREYTNMTIILFVLRMLKALDFQPRMALVTRTISTAFSDLSHFVALFCIIFVGYAISGNQLFGHQYEGLSNLNNACQFLILILLSFDPTQMWVQMEHAASSKLIFFIYIWTWVFLAFFVLLNIFLAILIEGYTAVKNSSASQQGILNEVMDLLWHEVRRLSQNLHGGRFISDDYLAAELAKRLSQTPTTAARALKDYSDIALGNCIKIYTESGKSVDLSQLRNILLELPAIRELEKPLICSEQSAFTTGHISEQQITYLDVALTDLMGRYGVIDDILVGSGKPGKPKQQLEYNQQHLSKETTKADFELELSLVLERARNISSMDVWRGADVFCAAFVDEGNNHTQANQTWSGLSSIGAGGRLFQTQIMRGISEADWTWNQEFKWTLPSFKLLDKEMESRDLETRQLVIMVYDKDQFSSDDVIGCVLIPLSSLSNCSPLDAWLPIVPPTPSQHWNLRKILHSSLTYSQPAAELKLKVTVREKVPGAAFLESPRDHVDGLDEPKSDVVFDQAD